METELIIAPIKKARQLPGGWKLSTLGSLVKLVNGYAFKPTDWQEEGLPIIRIQNLNDENATFNYFQGSIDERYYINKGDLLFAWSGTKGVSFGARVWNRDLAVLNQHIFKVIPANVDPDFCFYLLKGAQERIEKNAHGFKSTFVHVTKSDLEGVVMEIPPISQQCKIATILSTWDEAIQSAQQLLAAKQQRKRGLMQQFFTKQKRLPGFSGAWREVELNEIFQRVQRTNRPDVKEIMSISAKKGFVSQTEKFSKIIAGENLTNYTLLKRGEFAYNKGNSDLYPCGCIYKLDTCEEAAVPNIYFCFKNRGDVDDEFYKFYFQNRSIDRQLHRRINSGVRNDGLLNLNVNEFFGVQVACPPLEEQRAIAAVLNAADEEIRLAILEMEALQLQKLGLMQELLIGKKLVTVYEQKTSFASQS